MQASESASSPPLRIVRMRRIIGVALAVGYETTADGTELHPPLLWYACRPFRKEGRRCCCCCQVV